MTSFGSHSGGKLMQRRDVMCNTPLFGNVIGACWRHFAAPLGRHFPFNMALNMAGCASYENPFGVRSSALCFHIYRTPSVEKAEPVHDMEF